MPAPGAIPDENANLQAIDLGRGDDGIWRIATRYSDGSYVVWNGEGANEELAYIAPGQTDPADIGGGRAAVINPDGSLTAYSIANPPQQFSGTPAPGDLSTAHPVPTRDNTPTYAGAYGGQQTPGRPTDVPFGQTVAPSTWNAATPGRSEGWGSIGAGTAGIEYGYGSPGFGQDLLKINQDYLQPLSDPKLAPGYIPGSGTYNQFRLDQPGLFGTIPGQQGTVNLRYGLGGTGDPTTGGEIQTPQRWITGRAGDSTQALQGDAAWRAKYGPNTPPGIGGGWDATWAGAVPGYQPPAGMNAPGYGASNPPAPQGMGGGGMGGGMFGSNVQSNWGQTPETAGLDFIATLFLRPDTPTGINTAAWSAPQQMWLALLDEIRKGRIFVQDPSAWQMLSEKFGQPVTPQSIGGAATGGQNAQPGGAAGTGSSTEDAIANANAAAAADKAAYWAYQQALLRQGDQRIALEEARDAWTKAYNTATMTGQFNGQDTMAMQQQRFAQGVTQAGLTGQYNGAPTVAEQQRLYEQGVTNAGLTGTYMGQDTMAKINQQNAAAQALLTLQSQLQGPRNWSAYQRTFGATPQGLKDVMAAYQGRYQLPTGMGAQGTAQGGQQSVAGLAGDILSGTYGQDGQSGTAMVNPRQADLQNWARMQPSQREMVLGNYEQAGWYGPDVENLMKTAAPKYSGPQTGSYNMFQA